MTTDTPPAAPASIPPILIPRTVLFGNPERTHARISPNGKYLAWSAPVDGLLNVFVAPFDDIAQARPITHERERPVPDFYWAPDSSMILYGKDFAGDENHHVMCVRVEGGEVRDLTPFEGAKAGIMGASHHCKDRVLVQCNKRDPQFFDVYSLDLATGALTLVFQNEGFAGFVADSWLKLRIAIQPRPDGGIDYFRVEGDAVEDEPFEQVDYEDARSTSPAGFSDDGKTLYWVDARGRDKTGFFAQDLASGEKQLLATDTHADISGVLTDPATNTPIAYVTDYLKPQYFALDPALQPDFDFLDKNVNGNWSIVSQNDSNDIWTLLADPVVAPAAVHLYARKTKTLTKLYTMRPELEGMPLVPMTPLEIRSRDGLTLVSYLTMPHGFSVAQKPPQPLPLVLCVHGGPWDRDTFGYDSLHQWLANRGYAVLSVNFRGSMGFGKSFVAAGDGEWGARMQDDLFDAIEKLSSEQMVDPAKIAILGGSYGGYAVLAGLAFTPDRFVCGVDIVGPSNLETLLASIPPYWEPLKAMFHRAVGDPDTREGMALLQARSPLHKAYAIKRPLLIGQGANDPRVKQAESDQLAAALEASDTPLTYVLYPDEGHGFARPTNSIAFWAITENFLVTYLGGRAEPIDEALAQSSAIVKTGADHVRGLQLAPMP
jgi:dipeptidyl aminopeptidase/acylaminoacyl peptidase